MKNAHMDTQTSK